MYENLVWIFRIVLAGLMGALVGYERHSRSKEAGVKTHCIVSLASALMMIVSKYGFADAPTEYDAARVAAQIVTGIGFLGAGIIFEKNDTIQGLTTAAGVWATSGIGMCIGAGMYVIGIFTALFIVGVQLFMRGSRYFGGARVVMDVIVTMEQSLTIEQLDRKLKSLKVASADYRVLSKNDARKIWCIEMDVVAQEEMNIQDFVNGLKNVEEIKEVDIGGKNEHN